MELAIKLEQARITTAEGTPLIKADSSLDEAVVDTIKTLLVGNHTQDLTEANTIINDTKTYLNNLPNLTADNLKPYKDAHTNLPILENRIKEALDLDPLLPLPNT
ncbi:11826_t:CDS:1 [Funneliformis geosporum]|uniref:2173_t:CDS:1 n=1 Tax=Funneliformis geosporum TaxID=1117311 RepID=A0A9W4WXG4_9GLOM|nr:11826_t:CDS:1 [Funneliformis geosporum]CAI2193752.1 2173_t:CDS:1 [Funneliformis geosporum]